jgi:DNA-repair protein complementing XP-A cells
MVLTEEQRERIRKNKERALRIQKERREQKEKKEEIKNRKIDKPNIDDKTKPSKKQKTQNDDHRYHSNAPLEDFEEGASEWVTKKEAMTMYCLPEGTMAVCAYEEKQNPRNPLFKPMKLYKRSEIRYRAHKRHGGLDGLIKERNKRRKRKLDKEMEEARDIFK